MSEAYRVTWDYGNPNEYLRLYEEFEMPPLMITVAISGGIHGKEINPNLPETPQEQALQTFDAYEAGASIVHIHARDPATGYANPSCDPNIYRDINKRIRELCPDIIISNTTGAGWGVPVEERIKAIQGGAEICSLDQGTMAIRTVYKARKPPLEGRPEDIAFDGTFQNTYGDNERFAEEMLKHGTKPELETFDTGDFWLIRNLISKNLIKPPYFICLVTGYISALPPTPWHLLSQMSMAPSNSIFNVLGIGVHELPMTTMAIILGAHVRVGLEDNVYYRHGVKAKNNAELVARIVRIAKELNRRIATPAEAREILGVSKTPSKY